jgi:hypothetical protein
MCGENCCNTNQPVTASQMLAVTFMRFKVTIVTLMLMAAAGMFYRILHHSVTIPFLVFSVFYLVVLNIGMRGAALRSVKMLRFYWIVQLVQLLAVLIVLVVGLSFFVYHHVRQTHYAANGGVSENLRSHVEAEVLKAVQKEHPHAGEIEDSTASVDPTDPQVDPSKPLDPLLHIGAVLPKKVVEGEIPQIAHANPNQRSWNCPLQNMPYMMIVPALIFLLLVFIKTRSIVLARQMIQLVEIVEEESGDVEVECGSEEEHEMQQVPDQESPVAAYYAPQAVYVMPNEYPGQLTPVYVDKFATH